MQAYTLDWVKENFKPGAKVLEIGPGSGFMTTALFDLVNNPEDPDQVAVVSIELYEDLAKLTQKNFNKCYPDPAD